MSRILKRCSQCGKFHASFLERDEKGNVLYLCKDCWKLRHPSGKPNEPRQPKPGQGR